MATAKQISQEIIDWSNSNSSGQNSTFFEEAWRDFKDSLEGWGSKTPEIQLPSGIATFFKRHGGEGMGEEYWVIFKVGEELFEVDGYYSSWDGVSWDGAELYKVAPVEVTIIEYQKVED